MKNLRKHVPNSAAVPSFGRKGVKSDYKVSKLESLKTAPTFQQASRKTIKGAPAVTSLAGKPAKHPQTVDGGSKLTSLSGKANTALASTNKMKSNTVHKQLPDTMRKMKRGIILGKIGR